jgi:hypothetical protein
MKTLSFFRANPDDPALCELVVSINGKLTKIPWPRNKCINAIRTLLPFVEASE